MHPVLFTVGGVEVRTYAVFVLLALAAAGVVRSHEVRRIGQQTLPGYRWVGVGALLGAVVGAKLGMVMFHEWDTVRELGARMMDLDFTGKTVVGALFGGYAGVELAKRWVGIHVSTGDGFAVAVPLGQATGRLGCFFNGCCHGTPTSVPWAVTMGSAPTHPVQLYEAALDLALAGTLWMLRGRTWPRGHLFRRYIVGYALIRFGVEFVRGDAHIMVGGLSAVQWLCAAVAALFTVLIIRGERGVPAPASVT